jgi:MazG family protein
LRYKLKSPEERIRELINLTKALRAEGGCPWDRKQTFLSLRNYIIEEAYEVVDAISRNDIGNLKEEVGDLLLQVLFITNIAEEESMFTFEDVILELSDKLIRRHPHVFGDKSAKDENEALKIWDEQKALGE